MGTLIRFTLTALLVLIATTFAHAGDKITYYHNDALGSPVAATNQLGQVIWRETYKPHGQRTTNAAASVNNKVWFTGKQEESALGINYFGARWYHPEVGRFLVIDLVGVSPENIHSFNRYGYANNNPYKYVDPDGRHPAIILGVGVGLGAVFGTNNAQAPTSFADLHPNMDTKTVEAAGAISALGGLRSLLGRGSANAAGDAAGGVDDLVMAAGGKTRSSGDIVVDGGRTRAKELFREFDVRGVGERTIVGDKTGGGRGVVGELGDGTPLRIRMKPDGSTRMQAGDQKLIFPAKAK